MAPIRRGAVCTNSLAGRRTTKLEINSTQHTLRLNKDSKAIWRMHATYEPNEYAITRISFAVSYFSFSFLFSKGWIGDFQVFSSLILSFRIRISFPRLAFAHMMWCDRRCSVRSVCSSAEMHSIDQTMIWFPFNLRRDFHGLPISAHVTVYTIYMKKLLCQ